MIRYLGNTWLSVREAANVLRWSEGAVAAAARSGQLAGVSRREAVRGGGKVGVMALYVSDSSVRELERRLTMLEAAFSEWPPLDRAV